MDRGYFPRYSFVISTHVTKGKQPTFSVTASKPFSNIVHLANPGVEMEVSHVQSQLSIPRLQVISTSLLHIKKPESSRAEQINIDMKYINIFPDFEKKEKI